MTQKNIDMIYDCVYPFSKGGAEKRVADYAKILSKENNVRIVSMGWWDGVAGFHEKTDIKYHSILKKKSLLNHKGDRKILLSLFFGVKVFFYILKRRNVDIFDIELFPYFPLIFARCAVFLKKRKPIIVAYWSEYLGEIYWKKNYGSLWRCGVVLEKLCFASCDHVIANSHFTKRKLQNAFKKKNKKIDVIAPASIDIKKIMEVTQQDKKYDIIYYGRIIAHKHVEHIVDVAEMLIKDGHKINVLIIGDGPDRDHLKEYIDSKNLAEMVILIDFVESYDDLIRQIKSAKIMIQPSEREGFGITVIEANACGLPVFVVDYPDNAAKELIEEGKNGFVCMGKSELSQKVLRFFARVNDEKKNAMACSSIACAQKYSHVNIKKKVVEYYDNI